MKVAVRYYSRSGNTAKLAEAIARQCGVEALPVSSPLSQTVDVLFLGSSLYAGKVDPQITAFLQQNQKQIKRMISFSTSAAPGGAIKPVRKLAQQLNIPLDSQEFHCPGKFLFLHTNRPNQKDLQEAAQFAQACLNSTKEGSSHE